LVQAQASHSGRLLGSISSGSRNIEGYGNLSFSQPWLPKQAGRLWARKGLRSCSLEKQILNEVHPGRPCLPGMRSMSCDRRSLAISLPATFSQVIGVNLRASAVQKRAPAIHPRHYGHAPEYGFAVDVGTGHLYITGRQFNAIVAVWQAVYYLPETWGVGG